MSDRLFPPNHETRLLSTFQYVDKTVSQALARLEPAPASPFSEFVSDAGAPQRKMAVEYLDRLRAVMCGFLDRHRIAVPNPSTSALWAASTACVSAGFSIEELRGRSMRAYGRLSPAADEELERLVSELTDMLRNMSGYFADAKNAEETANPGSGPGIRPRDTAG